MTPDEERFWEKVAIHDIFSPECWPWMGARDRNGYGRYRMNRKPFLAHRLAWLFARTPGETLDDRDILHRCDNPPCCNPFHLWAGTAADNVADMFNKGRQKDYSRKSHCVHGHEYTPENTGWVMIGKYLGRRCRACCRANTKAYYQRKRAQET